MLCIRTMGNLQNVALNFCSIQTQNLIMVNICYKSSCPLPPQSPYFSQLNGLREVHMGCEFITDHDITEQQWDVTENTHLTVSNTGGKKLL